MFSVTTDGSCDCIDVMKGVLGELVIQVHVNDN